MSWHYSQALVEEFLEGTCLDGEQYVRLNTTHTQQVFLCKDRMMEFSRLSRFGMTLELLTEGLGVELLMWFLGGFPAKTYPQQEEEKELMASVQVCGVKWRESSARYDPDTFSWKTAHCSLNEDLHWSSVTLPKWGMTRNGVVYQHPTLERPIKGIASGLLPTPLATDYKGGTTAIRKDTGKQRLDQFRDWIKCLHGLTYPIPEHSEAVMGWPVGWTDLKPLEMDRFLEWRQQHSAF